MKRVFCGLCIIKCNEITPIEIIVIHWLSRLLWNQIRVKSIVTVGNNKASASVNMSCVNTSIV